MGRMGIIKNGGRKSRLSLALLVVVAVPVGAWAQSDNVAAPEAYRDAVARLSEYINAEMQQKNIPALSIAVVSDQGIVWAQGFGFADREKKRPATAQTIYRVGSVSKLLSDMALVQLIDQGKLKLDEDIQSALPNFRPNNPFGKPITLRQLMSHQSGLVREPPVGNYFDASAPSLQQTVESLNSTTLVYPPGSRTKYSNAAVAVVGYAVEKVVERPFAEYIQSAMLDSLDMKSSSYLPTDWTRERMAAADMWSYDGRRFPAPDLTMGALPAGNLYSTVIDLSHFMQAIFNDGKFGDKQFLSPQLMRQMLGEPGGDKSQRTFGIGFAVGDFDGMQTFEHGGAIYGFATQFRGVKEKKLGVIVAASLDVANGFVNRIGDQALRTFLDVREGTLVSPRMVSTSKVERDFARGISGLYSDGKTHCRLVELAGRLILQHGSFDREVRRMANRYVLDSVLDGLNEIELAENCIRMGKNEWKRIDDPLPSEPTPQWLGLIGEYGWDHNTLFIYEDQGQLWALIEWVFRYPLKQESEDVFLFPEYGLYHHEKLYFTRDANGNATQVVAAEVNFPRRNADLDSATTYRIRPLMPAERLLEVALAAEPPEESRDFRAVDLVDLSTLDPEIRLDIRYATTNNFMGTEFYQQPKAFLQRPAAEAVLAAQRRLEPLGYGLLIHDAYRPWYVTKMFWEATPPEFRHFVANPDRGSRHNRGCAVDLTLYDLKTGEVVSMPSGYDEFSERAYPLYAGGTSRQRWHRELLRGAMESEGFDVYEFEWWHFDFRGWEDYPILNKRFEELEK
jgi:serine beta-lactamase-like protein LACTB